MLFFPRGAAEKHTYSFALPQGLEGRHKNAMLGVTMLYRASKVRRQRRNEEKKKEKKKAIFDGENPSLTENHGGGETGKSS